MAKKKVGAGKGPSKQEAKQEAKDLKKKKQEEKASKAAKKKSGKASQKQTTIRKIKYFIILWHVVGLLDTRGTHCCCCIATGTKYQGDLCRRAWGKRIPVPGTST